MRNIRKDIPLKYHISLFDAIVYLTLALKLEHMYMSQVSQLSTQPLERHSEHMNQLVAKADNVNNDKTASIGAGGRRGQVEELATNCGGQLHGFILSPNSQQEQLRQMEHQD